MKAYICLISGKKISKNEAFRFVLSPDNQICLDLEFKLTGKNIIVAREESLIKEWFNSDFFSKNLNVEPQLDLLKQQILKLCYNKILTFIALAKKSGKVQLGKKQVEQGLKNKKDAPSLILQATDASIREKFKENSENHLLEIFDSNELSDIMGKEKLYYLLLEGDFVPLIMELVKIYKILKEYK